MHYSLPATDRIGGRTPLRRVPTESSSLGVSSRPRVDGKFLRVNGEKFYVRGVSYGAFRPDDEKREYFDEVAIERDFQLMAENGFNTVRIPHTMPPRSLLDIAQRHGLYVMVGCSAEQYVGFLIDGRKKGDPNVEEIVRERVRSVAGHPALLCYGIGNEIPSAMARWIGRRRIEKYLRRIFDIVKDEDPRGLVTYVNYPTTEYLQLPFLDFVSFNVYLETEETLRKYLWKLQNLAGDRPLLMSEVGLDAVRNGEDKQAEVLYWQIREAFAAGCIGAVVFSWTDEWFRGGAEVDDWAFGLTDRDRVGKPALRAVRDAFEAAPFPKDWKPAKFSVVVCSYNGSRTIRETLEHLDQLEYPDYEVIVVDDGSMDQTAAIAGEFDVNLIRTENRGLSSARNTGLKAASGEYVAFIDDDAFPDPHWLQYLAHLFETTGHSAAGGPNIPPWDEGFAATCVANAPGGPAHVLLTDEVAEHIPGCNMAFRRADLAAIGGFDETFRVAGDDVDVCWRIQEQSWTIGFHPAAMVWHRRRNSMRTYWKQQLGYGKAEALLEEKWPEKYNPAGYISWGGRVYGTGHTHTLGRAWRIYQGMWGMAPFQSLEHAAPHILSWLPAMPEWWLVMGALAGLTVLGLLWTPLFWTALVALVLAVGIFVVQAAFSVRRARISADDAHRWRRGALQRATFALHVLQPIARLFGRQRHGLTAWRRYGGRNWIFPRPRRTAFFTENWIEPARRLYDIDSELRRHSSSVQCGGDYDHWDIQVHGGFGGAARMVMAIEDQGSGTQYVRLQSWPRWRRMAVYPILVVVGFAILSLVFGQWVVAGIFGVIALVGMIRATDESGCAQAAILEAAKAAMAATDRPENDVPV